MYDEPRFIARSYSSFQKPRRLFCTARKGLIHIGDDGQKKPDHQHTPHTKGSTAARILSTTFLQAVLKRSTHRKQLQRRVFRDECSSRIWKYGTSIHLSEEVCPTTTLAMLVLSEHVILIRELSTRYITDKNRVGWPLPSTDAAGWSAYHFSTVARHDM